MYYSTHQTATLKKIDKGQKEIAEAKEIYDLKVTKKGLKSNSFVLKLDGKKSRRTSSYPFNLDFYKVLRVLTNPKMTVKLCVLTEGYYLLMGQNTCIAGTAGIAKTRTYGDDTYCDIFNLRQGMWVAVNRDQTPSKSVAFGIDGHMGDCKNIFKILEEKENGSPLILRGDFSSKGIVLPSLFKKEWLELLYKNRVQVWTEQSMKWLENECLKKNLTFIKKLNYLKVVAKAFDGHTYTLVIKDNLGHKRLSYSYSPFLERESWLQWVYIGPLAMIKHKINPSLQNARLENRFNSLIRNIDGFDDVFIKKDRKGMHLKVTISKSGARLYTYNGQHIRREDIYTRYTRELQGIKWFTKGQKKRGKQRALSIEATELLEKGLNGEILDLEGEFPFHLSVLLKENKWYLSIGGKEFNIKGGLTALNKVKTAIRGTARVQDRGSGYWIDSRRTPVILGRIETLIGRKNALWVIKQVKIMGAMIKTMKGTN